MAGISWLPGTCARGTDQRGQRAARNRAGKVESRASPCAEKGRPQRSEAASPRVKGNRGPITVARRDRSYEVDHGLEVIADDGHRPLASVAVVAAGKVGHVLGQLLFIG